MSTVGWDSIASTNAMRASLALSPRVLAAQAPISSPALKLSVAKVASAALVGSSGVSSAITRMPACRAFSTDGTIALVSLAVMRMPLAPAAIRFSMAATCVSLSPSYLPAKLCSSTPSFLASASAPSFILAKNGLVLVLVMRPTITLSSAPAGAGPRATDKAVTATHATQLFQGDADECPRATARSTIMSSSQFGPRLPAGRFFGDMAVLDSKSPFCLLSSRSYKIYAYSYAEGCFDDVDRRWAGPRPHPVAPGNDAA